MKRKPELNHENLNAEIFSFSYRHKTFSLTSIISWLNSQPLFNAMKHDIHLVNIYKFDTFLTENTPSQIQRPTS
jgi:hypothetical protein